ncbi:uncharacterized protein LOC128552200 [Mercenaria mercenaria]|uniref:uncharacterized protein LOC128552200 n=1 Tax=Mercenaria mercenaria TaxID=6596 RepID=UPI00234E64DA|nr:uncharacterized protein LOC128552200 [Mercenaria mercenaria]
MATISNERHLRYILLLGEGGTLVLRELLERERHQSGKTLEVLLELNKTTLKRQTSEFQKVFPANGIPDVNTWDISLLATVILQLFKKSLTSDESNEIRKLKDMRNGMAHASSLSMDENEYDEDRKELASTLIKLSNGLDRTVSDRCQTFIKEFATGPVDIHAATERVKELSKYDEMISAEIRSLTRKVGDVSEDMQELKQMMRKMMHQNEDFHSFQVIDTKMALRGPNEELTVTAEESITRLFRSALKRTGGEKDMTKLCRAVRTILEEIENYNGVEVLEVERECIRISLKCSNCRGLLELLEYLEGNLFQQRCQELSIALEETYNGSFAISAEITTTTVMDLLSSLRKFAENNFTDREDQTQNLGRTTKPKPINTDTTKKELSTKIMVSGIPPSAHIQYLKLFFENTKYGGGPVHVVSLNEETSTAIIEFESQEAVDIVLSKQYIEMMGQAVKVEVWKPVPACTIAVCGSACLVCEDNLEILQLYFEHPKSYGGTVKAIMFDRASNSALVTFETEEGLQIFFFCKVLFLILISTLL